MGGSAPGGDEFGWEQQTGTGDIAVLGWDDAETTVHYGSRWTGNVLPENRQDYAVKFYARHNETHQYFLVDIIDDEINTDDPEGAAWANDSVEFFIDPSNDRGGTAGGDPAWESDVQLVIDAANNVQVWNSPPDYEAKIEAGVKSAVTTTATGWLLEVGIAKSVFDTPLPPVLGPANDPNGRNYGIDLTYRDQDDPDDIGVRNGDPLFSSHFAWADPNSGGGFPTKVPDNWGQMILGVPQVVSGDYNNNKALDAGDLDLQAEQMVLNPVPPPAGYDLNKDNAVNFTDRLAWLHDLRKTWVGDSNLDGQFKSDDFVLAFQAGKYEVVGAEAKWEQGDWDGNQRFTSADFVAAFADGGYEAGPRPAAVSAVPEPGSVVLILLGTLLLVRRRQR